MKGQFNRQYDVRNRTCKRGDSVRVRTYNGQRVSWTKGKVPKRVGRVLHQVLVGGDTWIGQANQLRKGFADRDCDQSDDLRTLFEMFGLEQPLPQQTVTSLNDCQEVSSFEWSSVVSVNASPWFV
ncbi:hypothetical protein Tcan_00075 [Toxocara canis]|uniref:Uncharacterized protein n=1 Tax=Toxocara canis TaxID=6265 RepID=A0A0B2V5X9_TOXCA|nr:hypothetical protein Tcan_00075 [Toxocara canis]